MLLTLSIWTVLAASSATALGFGDRPLEGGAFAGALMILLGAKVLLRR